MNGYALEKATHEVINEYIAEHLIEGFSFDQYLKEQLGFQEGIDKIIEQFEGQEIDCVAPEKMLYSSFHERPQLLPWTSGHSLQEFLNCLKVKVAVTSGRYR